MRKYLLGATAAIAGVALALPASAEEMDDMMEGVSISGYMNHDFGFGSYDGGEMTVEDFHMETDAELTFTASGTTDGGLKVTAAIEVTGSGGGSGIDESQSDDRGRFRLHQHRRERHCGHARQQGCWRRLRRRRLLRLRRELGPGQLRRPASQQRCAGHPLQHARHRRLPGGSFVPASTRHRGLDVG